MMEEKEKERNKRKRIWKKWKEKKLFILKEKMARRKENEGTNGRKWINKQIEKEMNLKEKNTNMKERRKALNV